MTSTRNRISFAGTACKRIARLSSTGTATLDGTLNVASVGTPVNGAWTMVSGATITGSFASNNLPTLSVGPCSRRAYAAPLALTRFQADNSFPGSAWERGYTEN